MDMIRIRMPELLNPDGIGTAYAIAKASNKRISVSGAHRLIVAKGAIKRYDADLIEALCEMFGIGPGDLFEISERKEPKAIKPKSKRAKR